MSVSWKWTRRRSRCSLGKLGRGLADELPLGPALVLLESLEQRRQVVEDVAHERVHDEWVQLRVHLQELAEAEGQVVEGAHEAAEARHGVALLRVVLVEELARDRAAR